MMLNSNRWSVLVGCALFSLIATFDAQAGGASGWAIYGGTYDTAEDDQPLELGLEYRWSAIKPDKFHPRLALKPTAGIAGTEDGNAWVYGGLRLDVKLGEHWVTTPQFSVSLYDEGDGKDLGGVVEFRSGLEVAYRFESGQRLGLLFYHLSNADFYDRNPGSNSLVLTWGFGR